MQMKCGVIENKARVGEVEPEGSVQRENEMRGASAQLCATSLAQTQQHGQPAASARVSSPGRADGRRPAPATPAASAGTTRDDGPAWDTDSCTAIAQAQEERKRRAFVTGRASSSAPVARGVCALQEQEDKSERLFRLQWGREKVRRRAPPSDLAWQVPPGDTVGIFQPARQAAYPIRSRGLPLLSRPVVNVIAQIARLQSV